MSTLDSFYFAFKAYQAVIENDKEAASFSKAAHLSNPSGEKVIVITSSCHIDADWIDAIEEGLVYVEKAVKEERQFIRNNGEVVPVEKAKRISTASVEHLARHSDLITHLSENPEDGIVPDRILMVEKLSDYAVYENRFLYACLVYLQEFISIRFDKIRDLTNKFMARTTLYKTVAVGKRHVVYDMKLNEEVGDDPYVSRNNPSKGIIDRIDGALHTVNALLKTPLMIEVAKSPMVKPPIVKTNVLKMNQNFKHALSLYDFVTAYSKDGYEIVTTQKVLNPFSDDVSKEFAELLSLTSFLSYKAGEGLEAELHAAYLAELERRKALEDAKRKDQLRSLKKRAAESGESLEEYALLLEKENRALEGQLLAKEGEIAEIKEKHALELAALKIAHAEEIASLTVAHEKELAIQTLAADKLLRETEASYEKQLKDQSDKHQSELAMAEEKHLNEVNDLKAAHEKTVADLTASYDSKVNALNASVAEKEHAYSLLEAQDAAALQEAKDAEKAAVDAKTMALAELHAIRSKQGLLTSEDDFTSEARFDELEAEKAAFEKLFANQWKKTKKKIRGDLFAKKPAAKKKGGNGK